MPIQLPKFLVPPPVLPPRGTAWAAWVAASMLEGVGWLLRRAARP